MNDMQKEWKTYTKRVILKRLYNENSDQRVTDFLKNYDLLKVNVLNNDAHEFRMEILFSQRNETVRIVGQFKPGDQRFIWIFPGNVEIIELEKILDEFDFDRSVEEEI